MYKRILALLLLLGLLSGTAGPASTAEEALPAEDFIAAQVPSQEAEAPAPEDAAADAVPFAPEEVAAEAVDLSTLPAVGTAGVAYAGVHYLSRAAYDSMSAEQQSFYTRAVDGVTAALDHGTALEHVVFSLTADGKAHLQCGIALRRLFSASGGAEPPVAISLPPAAEEEPSASDDAAPLVENVELAAQWRVPLVKLASPPDAQTNLLQRDASGRLRRLHTRFWDEMENYYYNQLSGREKLYYDAARASFIDGDVYFADDDYGANYNGFTLSDPDVDVGELSEEDIDALLEEEVVDPVSALILTYPRSFDWMDLGLGEIMMEVYTDAIEVRLSASRHYKPQLERRAQAKVQELAEEALAFAQANFPDDVPYGMVRYFDEWICANNYYNDIGAEESVQALKSKAFYFCHNAYGILLKGYGVCESYALAMTRLLDAAGIPNLYVTGDTLFGAHAWNYVRMDDGGLYLLDATWDDPDADAAEYNCSTREYLLSGDDFAHMPSGNRYLVGESFDFPERSGQAYEPVKGELLLAQSEIYLAAGKSTRLTLGNMTYADDPKKWSSSKKSVARVNAKGKVTGLAAGTATIRVRAGGKTAGCTVHVVQPGKLGFKSNGKTTLRKRIRLRDGAQSYVLQLKRKGFSGTAEELAATLGLELKAKSGRKAVATASASLAGDDITLRVTPKKKGETKITVQLGTRTATLYLTVQ